MNLSGNEGLNVLSLFDGVSCAMVGLERAGIKVGKYYAVEIDPTPTKVSQKNYPQIVRPAGDVRCLTKEMVGQVDLLVGGSPCQDLSIAKQGRQGLEGNKSSLFFEYVRILKAVKPRWFLLENVASMPIKDRDIITREMGVEPVMFNASLVSAQNRKRLFWTNIDFELPTDRRIFLKDILEEDGVVYAPMVSNGKAHCLTASYSKTSATPRQIEHNTRKGQRTMVLGASMRGRKQADGTYKKQLEVRQDGKASSLTSMATNDLALVSVEKVVRILTPVECERLQGLPDGYTDCIAKTWRYKVLGNAFNVDVVAHIFKNLAVEHNGRTTTGEKGIP